MILVATPAFVSVVLFMVQGAWQLQTVKLELADTDEQCACSDKA